MWNPLGVVQLGPGPVDSNTTPKTGTFSTPAISIEGHRCLVCILADEPHDLAELKSHAQGWSITQFTDFIHRSRLAAWRNYDAVVVTPTTSLDVAISGYQGEDHEFALEAVIDVADPTVKLAIVVPLRLYEQLDMERKHKAGNIFEAVEFAKTVDGFLGEAMLVDAKAKPKAKTKTKTKDKDKPRDEDGAKQAEPHVRLWLRAEGAIELGRGVLPSGIHHACRLQIRAPKGRSKKKLGTVYIRQIHVPPGQPEVEIGRVTWELLRFKTHPSRKPPVRTKKPSVATKPARGKPPVRAKQATVAKYPPARAKKATHAKPPVQAK
jgi:hypothetical protein